MKGYAKKIMSVLTATIMLLTVLVATPINAEESQAPQMEWGRLPIGGKAALFQELLQGKRQCT